MLCPSSTAWSTDATVVCEKSRNEQRPQIIADGAGGAIIVWLDTISYETHHVEVQRLNADGKRQWATAGLAIADSVPHDTASDNPMVCTDGYGGAFVAYRYDITDHDHIYVRRVTASGTLPWSSVRVSDDDAQQMNFDICSDELGGVIVVWQDERVPSSNFNIYAQRINASGAKLWGENGTVVCDFTEYQVTPKVFYNGSNGIYVVWADRRAGDWNMYAQQLNLSGDRQWNSNGVEICGDPAYQSLNAICGDGNGGAIIAWSDSRDGPDDIYAQRITPNGAQLWGTDGKSIINASNNQNHAILCNCGTDGAYLIWTDKRTDTLGDIYAQRIDLTGAGNWTANGIPIANAANEQDNYDICSDGTEGAFIIWEDSRGLGDQQIYYQRINLSGNTYMPGNGTLLEDHDYDQRRPDIVNIGSGEAIMTWEQSNDEDYGIYAQIYPITVTGGPSIPGFTLFYLFVAVLTVTALYKKRILP